MAATVTPGCGGDPGGSRRSPRALPASARLIGIDVGTKTLGLALSDVTRTIASGLTTLRAHANSPPTRSACWRWPRSTASAAS